MGHKKKISIAILGAGATSCLLALILQKKKFNVTVLEGGISIGGAWAMDRKGPKFSNIIAPTNKKEKKEFKRSVNYLKKLKINFVTKATKTLYSKKIMNTRTANLQKLFLYSKKEINFKFSFKVKSINEINSKVLVNNKYKFDYVFFPTNFNINKVQYSVKKKSEYLPTPYLKITNSLHLRMFVKNLKKYDFKNLTIGPLDRFQIINLKKSISRINARVRIEWKKRSKKDIINEVHKHIDFEKLMSFDFFNYKSCLRDDFHTKLLKNNLNKTKRIKYFETKSILDFLLYNFFKKQVKISNLN
jgi:hypothetical protein